MTVTALLPRRLLPRHLIDAAQRTYGLKTGTIAGEDRHKIYLRPRVLVAVACRCWLGMSLLPIGRAMGRDHTTVMYYMRRAERELSNDDTRQTFENDLRDLIWAAAKLAGGLPPPPEEWAARIDRIRALEPPRDGVRNSLEPAPREIAAQVLPPPPPPPPPPSPATPALPSPPPAPPTKDEPDSLAGGNLGYRQWCEQNNERFVAAMRAAHPEMEIELRRVV